MDVQKAILERKSIRGYKNDAVSKEIIEDILKTAIRAPSTVNTQPWEFTVVAGKVLDDIRKENVENLLSTAKSAEARHSEYQGIYRERQVGIAKQLFKLMEIPREDKKKRQEWAMRGFRFFDAPAAIILSMESSLDCTWAIFDLGCVAQTICLAAFKHGLGTCIETQGVLYPEIIRKHTNMPQEKQIVIGIALGYPNWDFPANKVKSEREDIEAITSWYGFDK